jgi:hypothetical protein
VNVDSDICKLYAQGFSIAQVVDELGCSRHAVQRALLNAGVPRRGNSPLNRVGARPKEAQPVIARDGGRNEPVGNCVRCRRRIAFGQEYRRIQGLLGKVCLDCA